MTRTWRFTLLVGAFCVRSASTPLAQEPPPSFEIASIKINANRDGSPFYQAASDRFTVASVPLRMVLMLAYGVAPSQIVGAPDWADQDRFDIVAKAAAPFAPQTQWQEMLRTLLAERFKLSTHRESRPAQVYALVRDRQNGGVGTSLRPAAASCDVLSKGVSGADPCGLVDGNRVVTSGRMRVRGLPLTVLASLLRSEVGREIRDETGLTGEFDWELTFAPRRTDADGPSVFTAVREQLGLRLEPRRSTLDVIVIDHVERPSPD